MKHRFKIEVVNICSMEQVFVLICLCVTAVQCATKSRLRFVVLGDIGGVPWWPYSQWNQRLVAKRISQIPDIDFVVGAGDNFYFQGVKNVDDLRFHATFERVYKDPAMQKNWYMIAGNHDYHGNVSAQILYTKKSKRWNFPHFFYTKVFPIPKSNRTLQILMLDTVILCFSSLIQSKNIPDADTQMKWITDTLNRSKADYLIVVGHHPMFSAGRHGSNKCIQDKLEELFKKHKVSAYISGHDHDLQHIVPQNSSVEYFVNGAANWYHGTWINYKTLEPNSLKMFEGNSLGFLLVTAGKDRLKIEFRTTNPLQKYERYFLPRTLLPEYSPPKFPKLLEDFFKSMKVNV